MIQEHALYLLNVKDGVYRYLSYTNLEGLIYFQFEESREDLIL